MIKNTNLDTQEIVISLDVKSLYIKVPLKKNIDIAPKIYSARMSQAPIYVHFKCSDIWYVQKDGLALGSSLEVFLAYL